MSGMFFWGVGVGGGGGGPIFRGGRVFFRSGRTIFSCPCPWETNVVLNPYIELIMNDAFILPIRDSESAVALVFDLICLPPPSLNYQSYFFVAYFWFVAHFCAQFFPLVSHPCILPTNSSTHPPALTGVSGGSLSATALHRAAHAKHSAAHRAFDATAGVRTTYAPPQPPASAHASSSSASLLSASHSSLLARTGGAAVAGGASGKAGRR